MGWIPITRLERGKDHAVKLTVGDLTYHFDGLDKTTAKSFFAALSAAMNLEYGEEGVLELLQPVRFP